ncbi:flavin reductase family protein [Actinosynnema sp. NPDC091369]
MSEHRSLREALGRFVTGVTVVTAASEQGPVGLTVNSFTSVSLDPALVLFCLRRDSRVGDVFESAASFAVNILGEHQESVSKRFSGPVEERTEGVALDFGVTGAPLLADALAYLDCDLHRRIDAGDHVIIIGWVRDFEIRRAEARPLAFYGGRYAVLGR